MVLERHRLLGWMVRALRGLGYCRDQGNMRGWRYKRVSQVGSTRGPNLPREGRRGADAAGVHEHRDQISRCPRKSAFRVGPFRPQWVSMLAIRGDGCHDTFVRCPMMIRPNCIRSWRNRVSVRVATWKS